MQDKQELIHWLESLPDNAQIGIDEGGLCLRVIIEDTLSEEWNEIGGIPEEIENDDFAAPPDGRKHIGDVLNASGAIAAPVFEEPDGGVTIGVKDTYANLDDLKESLCKGFHFRAASVPVKIPTAESRKNAFESDPWSPKPRGRFY